MRDLGLDSRPVERRPDEVTVRSDRLYEHDLADLSCLEVDEDMVVFCD